MCVVPGVGLTPVDKPDKDHVSRALSMAQKSTASLGKFDESLPKEKPEKQRGKKRKVCLIAVIEINLSVHLLNMGSHASKVLNFFSFFEDWKVLEDSFVPGKFTKWEWKVFFERY